MNLILSTIMDQLDQSFDRNFKISKKCTLWLTSSGVRISIFDSQVMISVKPAGPFSVSDTLTLQISQTLLLVASVKLGLMVLTKLYQLI